MENDELKRWNIPKALLPRMYGGFVGFLVTALLFMAWALWNCVASKEQILINQADKAEIRAAAKSEAERMMPELNKEISELKHQRDSLRAEIEQNKN